MEIILPGQLRPGRVSSKLLVSRGPGGGRDAFFGKVGGSPQSLWEGAPPLVHAAPGSSLLSRGENWDLITANKAVYGFLCPWRLDGIYFLKIFFFLIVCVPLLNSPVLLAAQRVLHFGYSIKGILDSGSFRRRTRL